VSVHDISVTKRIDISTPQLMVSCASGKHIVSGLITVRKAGEKPLEYLKIKLEDILISSVQMGGSGGGMPSDSVGLDFKKATFTVFQILPTGALGTSFSALIINTEQGLAEPPPAPPA
jgi:type VI secretion system secreted protein Hcp